MSNALESAAVIDSGFRIEYVALHSSRALPLYLKVSALWAGQEGSLLLWSFLQALFAALAVRWPSERTRPLLSWASVFLNLAAAFFVAVTLFLSNPFALSESASPDGQGVNPLLRHPGMIFHPPALYLGYVGLAVPFAFALVGPERAARSGAGAVRELPPRADRGVGGRAGGGDEALEALPSALLAGWRRALASWTRRWDSLRPKGSRSWRGRGS